MEHTDSMSLPSKEEALDAFFNRFGTFYEVDSVPGGEHKPAFPYGTFEVAVDSFGTEVAISANWWERSSSWVSADAKANEIEHAVGRGGQIVRCDGGAMWIKPASPFVRSTGDDADAMLKRKIFNFSIEFLTEV